MAGNIGSNPFMEANMGYGTIVDNNLLPRGNYNQGFMDANYPNPVDSALQRSPQKDEFTISKALTTVAKGGAIAIGAYALYKCGAKVLSSVMGASGGIKKITGLATGILIGAVIFNKAFIDGALKCGKKALDSIANVWNKMFS